MVFVVTSHIASFLLVASSLRVFRCVLVRNVARSMQRSTNHCAIASSPNRSPSACFIRFQTPSKIGKANPTHAAVGLLLSPFTPHNSHPTHAVSATAFVAVGSDKQNTSCSQAERLCMRLAFGTRCLKAVPNSTTAAATQQERPRPHNKER